MQIPSGVLQGPRDPFCCVPMFLAPELQCERNSCDHLGFCASGLVFQDMGEALSHLCFCYNFPLFSTQKLSLGTWEALKANSPHSIIIRRNNTFEKKGLLEFKHHLPSSTSPLRCLLLRNPLRGLYWAVQSTNCLREAPARWAVFLRRGSHRPFWGLLLIFREPDSVLSQSQTPALTRCSSGNSPQCCLPHSSVRDEKASSFPQTLFPAKNGALTASLISPCTLWYCRSIQCHQVFDFQF